MSGSKKKKTYIMWGFLVGIQIIIMLYWANQKVGVHVDEMFTFESVHNLVIHSYGEPLYRLSGDANLRNQWHDQEYFQSHFTVNEGESFLDISLKDKVYVLIHQKWHKIMLNIVMSMQRGEYNLWVSFWLNAIIFVLLQFFLWKLSQKILMKNSLITLLPVMLFGISSGAVSFVIYIRQYTQYMLAAVILTMFGIILLEPEISWKKQLLLYVGIFLTVWISMRDMEFTLVFFAVQFSFVFLILLLRRDKRCIFYIGAAVAGLGLMGKRIINLILYGGMLENLLYRDWKETFITAQKILDMYQELVLGDVLCIWFTILLLGLGIGYCAVKKAALKFYTRKQLEILTVIFGTIICYSLIIIRITERQYQYLSCCFPLCFLGFVLLINPLIEKVSPKAVLTAAIMLGGLVLYSNAYFKNVLYLVREPEELVEELKKKEYQIPYIYVNKITEDELQYLGLYTLYRDIWLWKADVPYFVTTQEDIKNNENLDINRYKDEVLLWIDITDDQNEVFSQFMEKTGFNSAVEIGKSEKSVVYYCTKV